MTITIEPVTVRDIGNGVKDLLAATGLSVLWPEEEIGVRFSVFQSALYLLEQRVLGKVPKAAGLSPSTPEALGNLLKNSLDAVNFADLTFLLDESCAPNICHSSIGGHILNHVEGEHGDSGGLQKLWQKRVPTEREHKLWFEHYKPRLERHVSSENMFGAVQTHAKATAPQVNAGLERLISERLGFVRIPEELAIYSLAAMGLSNPHEAYKAIKSHAGNVGLRSKGRDGDTSWVNLDPFFSPNRSRYLLEAALSSGTSESGVPGRMRESSLETVASSGYAPLNTPRNVKRYVRASDIDSKFSGGLPERLVPFHLKDREIPKDAVAFVRGNAIVAESGESMPTRYYVVPVQFYQPPTR